MIYALLEIAVPPPGPYDLPSTTDSTQSGARSHPHLTAGTPLELRKEPVGSPFRSARCKPMRSKDFRLSGDRRCSLKCPWCVTPAIHDKHFDLTPEVLDRFLMHPAVRNCALVVFTGGEPLLNSDLAILIARARSHGHLASMTTNGLNLDTRIEELKRAGITMINVSVYNTNFSGLADTLPRTNNTFRVRTNKIVLRTVLEENPGEIEEAIRISIETGCFGTVLFLCLPHDDGIENVVSEDHQAYLDFKERIRAKYPKYSISWPQPAKRHRSEERRVG